METFTNSFDLHKLENLLAFLSVEMPVLNDFGARVPTAYLPTSALPHSTFNLSPCPWLINLPAAARAPGPTVCLQHFAE